MIEQIIKIVSTIAKISPDELGHNIEKEGLWDSFSHIEIILSIEEQFHVSFSQNEIATAKSIKKIAESLKKKVK